MSRAESEAALEESRAAAGEVLEQERIEAEPAGPQELAAETPELPPEEAPGERPGFFARFRKSRPAEEALEEASAGVPEEEPVGAGSPRPEPDILPPDFPQLEIEAPEEEEAPTEDLEPRQSMFLRLRQRLSRTRETLAGGLDRLFAGRKEVDAALLEELEELLITADIGVETTLALIQALHEKLRRRELADVERLKAVLKAEMVALLTAPPPPEIRARPWVVLVVGINGVGKTTTIAKLAHRDRARGLTPMLVAADTFRAAAVEQLEIWGERVGAAVIKQKTGADPAAVVFDGLAAAQSRGVDTVYVDTAGRLHTKVNLMEELKKIHRTAAKKLPGAPQEVFLVLDATTGQNALSQARLFHEAVGLTGLVLTKMDGTAKGGVALGVVHETGIPLRYIGVGEAMEDLRPFDAEAFVEAILG
ncbi:MAG: signal recognition particle-docking protein FtsY [Deltaproteobacteria bacterium]|nr:signal recognition particle-docking protein FtsY [Deltaproteobacteria bacterium]